jgi:hypothetical protein
MQKSIQTADRLDRKLALNYNGIPRDIARRVIVTPDLFNIRLLVIDELTISATQMIQDEEV